MKRENWRKSFPLVNGIEMVRKENLQSIQNLRAIPWIRAHPLRAQMRGVWLLFNAAPAAIGGGVLFYGPLEAGWAIAVLAGSAAGLFVGGLWLRQQAAAVRGELLTARRWKRWLLTGQLAVIVSLGLLAAFQLYDAGFFLPPVQDREANFERLWRAIDKQYPYFELKGADWDEVYERYQPLAASAADDEAYFRVVSSMLAELNDAHTGLLRPAPRDGRLYFATGKLLDDGIVVDEIGQTAREAGVERGMQVLEVDRRPVEVALAALPVPLWNGGTPWQREHSAAFNVLSTTNDSLHVTLLDPAGEVRQVTLTRPEETPNGSAQNQGSSEPLVSGEVLASGLGLIRIPTFASGRHDLVAEFDSALEDLADTPGIIIDLRGNGGGSSTIADRIAGRFVSETFIYGQDVFRQRLPFRAWRQRWEYRVTPRGWTYTAPVVLLIDASNMSTAEMFIAAMADSGRAQTVGRRTGGSSGNPVTFKLPGGGLARFSTGAFYRLDGTLIEGVGIIPDVTVPYTLEDFWAGRDPDLEAAEQLLLHNQGDGT